MRRRAPVPDDGLSETDSAFRTWISSRTKSRSGPPKVTRGNGKARGRALRKVRDEENPAESVEVASPLRRAWRRYIADVARWKGAPPDPLVRKLDYFAREWLLEPGVRAVGYMRLQLALEEMGLWGWARAIHQHNLRATGAVIGSGLTVGPGLIMKHPVGVVLAGNAVIGENVTILQGVTLGEKYGDGSDPRHAAPHVGGGTVLGAGAVVIGPVTIGAGSVIGANAVVTRDVPIGETVVGAPAVPLRPAVRDVPPTQ